ncbi:MAG TPA: hypothetical protein VNJ07_02475, partial [Chitinophagales bacterium]|nr:hypothetical protein [Chitinophagales bacterium]
MEVRDTKLSAALWRAALLSIAAIFMLRLYAIFFTVHVVAFDDKGYRRLAVNNFESTSLKGAVKDVLLPYNGEVYGRVGNYTSWLALGLKFCPECNRENIFHLVNFLIFLIQGAVVYAFSFLAARDKPFSAAAAFLYLSSPICFGMNRFLMPENLVLTAPLILSFAAFRLAVKSNSVSAVSEIFAAAVAAFLIGL